MKATSCRHDKKVILLYHYGELSDSEAADVKVQVGICPSCREYLSELGAIESLLPRSPSVEPGDEVMNAIREVTSRKIRAAAGLRRAPATGFGLFNQMWPRLALASVVMILVFLAGRWSTGSGGDFVPSPGGLSVADISDLSYDEATGTISIQVQTTDASAIEGSFSDQRVRSLVARALVDADRPATRFRAVKMINDMDIDRIQPDRMLVTALTTMLQDDSNQGMQLQAIRALRRIHGQVPLDPELKELLMTLLESSSNSALRMDAMEMLTESELVRQDLDRVLSRASQDKNSFIRFKARSALDDLQGSIPLDQIN